MTEESQPPYDRRQGFAEARRSTDQLFELVQEDSLFERPVPERHRLNFYIGHMEAFDWNLVAGCGLGLEPFQPDYDSLFAFGIDPDSDSLPSDEPADWPGMWETREYSRRVRAELDAVMDELPEEVAQTCIEHRLMHAETLCYMLHNLDPELLAGEAPQAQGEPGASPAAIAGEWVEIPAGKAQLGRERGNGFGWDNEFGAHTLTLPGFFMRKHKVTNGEYVPFVRDCGKPHYWRNDGGEWMLRTMFGEIPLPLDWPVYVTHEQALAFAELNEAALPSEAQWDRAAYGSDGPAREFPWGDADGPLDERANLNFLRWDPCSVLATPSGDSAYGVSQILGNGWEWTCEELRPFPGFKEYDFYLGYSSNFFDDEHFILKGGSPRTALQLARRSFRNWFRRDYRYAFAGIRLVRDI